VRGRRFADDRVLARIRIRNFDYVGIQDALAGVQTGATVKARLPTTSRVKPSDLRAQAEKLIADGMMPDLDSVLDGVGQIRSEYCEDVPPGTVLGGVEERLVCVQALTVTPTLRPRRFGMNGEEPEADTKPDQRMNFRHRRLLASGLFHALAVEPEDTVP